MWYLVPEINVEHLACDKPIEAKKKLTYKLQVSLRDDSRRFNEQDGHNMTLKRTYIMFFWGKF